MKEQILGALLIRTSSYTIFTFVVSLTHICYNRLINDTYICHFVIVPGEIDYYW